MQEPLETEVGIDISECTNGKPKGKIKRKRQYKIVIFIKQSAISYFRDELLILLKKEGGISKRGISQVQKVNASTWKTYAYMEKGLLGCFECLTRLVSCKTKWLQEPQIWMKNEDLVQKSVIRSKYNLCPNPSLYMYAI